jgi:integrase
LNTEKIALSPDNESRLDGGSLETHSGDILLDDGSELLAIRWSDIDFDNLELSVTRSIWHQVVGDCKTEASAKPVPLDSYMAEDLLRWRRQSPYPMDDDWVFASPAKKGKQPYWPDNLMKR